MKNAVTQKTRLAIFAPLTVAAFVSFLITSGALAGKPGGGGTNPTHTLFSLGVAGDGECALNRAGIVAYSDFRPGAGNRAFVLVPLDTNGNGRPDTWFRDSNGDGQNDLAVGLGVPPGYTTVVDPESVWLIVSDINDAGQVVLLFVLFSDVNGTRDLVDRAIYLITPTDVNQDGKLEWFQPDATGANALMTRIELCPMDAEDLHSNPNPVAINNAGQIVGTYAAGDRGFLVDPLDTDGDGVRDTWFKDDNADGINDLLVDLGVARSSGGSLYSLVPAGVNDAGQVVGGYPWPPFLINPRRDSSTGRQIWNEDLNGDGVNDRVIMLPTLSLGRGCANAINAAGVMAGWSQVKSFASYAVLWRVDAQGQATLTNLGVKGTAATGINASQQVVGDWGSTAFLWQNGVMTTLPAPMASAHEINDSGVILGHGVYPSGYYVAVPKSLLP